MAENWNLSRRKTTCGFLILLISLERKKREEGKKINREKKKKFWEKKTEAHGASVVKKMKGRFGPEPAPVRPTEPGRFGSEPVRSAQPGRFGLEPVRFGYEPPLKLKKKKERK
ncbi:hypothetical protein Sjap_014795 [Stephania japonica]|uniref:Uncharacterized protein n=1 Tax=Stephania japonica TaxID=461633 RepID=A0AAP0IJ01_9MAGN